MQHERKDGDACPPARTPSKSDSSKFEKDFLSSGSKARVRLDDEHGNWFSNAQDRAHDKSDPDFPKLEWKGLELPK